MHWADLCQHPRGHHTEILDFRTRMFSWAIIDIFTGLTSSCPLESCWLTVCSSCCSSLTVWFSPAVIFSFLSISSYHRERKTAGSEHSVITSSLYKQTHKPRAFTKPTQSQVLTLCDDVSLFSISSSVLSVTFESSP